MSPTVAYPSHSRILRFPSLYGAIIAAGSLDVWLTGILLEFGAREANPLANAVLHAHGFFGMVLFKYLIVGLVILACEFVADRDRRKARILAIALIAIHAAPLPWSTGLLFHVV
ncbi:MAG: DUF5658 family protein [Planctomycetota bacterium]